MQDQSSQSTSARETREAEGRSATAMATHGEAETRRELVQLQLSRDRTRAKEAMVAMPMAAKQQVIARSGGRLFGLWSFMPIRRNEECRVGSDVEAERGRAGVRRGSFEGVDGDGEDGR